VTLKTELIKEELADFTSAIHRDSNKRVDKDLIEKLRKQSMDPEWI
jgi:hypothetical protein